MTSRVLLVSPAMTPALRQARFYDGDSIEDVGAARARSAAGSLPAPARVVVSASTRCRETARALGLEGAVEEAALRGVDVGRWRGRALDEVTGAEPEALGHWLTDPEWAGHGGESVREVCARVGAWLDGAADGRTVAVVEPEIVRAAVVGALGLPMSAFWRLDVVPLTATGLSGRAGRWNLRLGGPLVAPEA
ncbi:histidine phosphatase family protein [Streptomyces griseofuscus]|uniref:histidine phosphatase family protein n=1 Tax=Streptomyces TaxID=1883 RepID=UPI0011892876|nr:histidine phosphatase family protein [Streptomyces murinus]MBA9049569.1 broad specificity phosphatase PhoE [Streptomyces murinus]BBC92196.1 histidine phosphatase family protein [Streptomyces rochei]